MLGILNFSGHVIMYDSDQHKLFTLSFIPKTVVHPLLAEIENIDTMDFGKL
jgi:hypothetical protein